MPTDDPLAVFGRKVRRLRGARRISIPELSQRSGLSSLSIASIEGGEGVLSVSVLRALAKGLGIQPDELLRGLPMLTVTAATRHLFAAPAFMSASVLSSSASSALSQAAPSMTEGARALRARVGSARAPRPAISRSPSPRPPRAGEVALLSALHDAALKRPPT